MISGLLPREGRFFDYFKALGGFIVDGATEFNDLLNNMGDAERLIRNIKDIEHKGDEVTHRTVELLHKTFITPLDREDIHALISKMDDILDFTDAAAQRVLLYEIKVIPQEGKELAKICLESAKLVQEAVHQLENLKHPEEIMKKCVEINRLENEADSIYRSAMARLFREENDLRNLIKLKELYELLETVTDRCEDVANIIEGIVLEYA